MITAMERYGTRNFTYSERFTGSKFVFFAAATKVRGAQLALTSSIGGFTPASSRVSQAILFAYSRCLHPARTVRYFTPRLNQQTNFRMNIKHRDMDDPAISAELFKLVPLPFRFAGLLAGAALVAAPQLSKADTVAETLPATQTSCLHSMNALVGGARGSATRIEISMPSPTSKMARIFVPDGEVRVVCDSVSHQMKLSRVLDAADDETADELALNTQKPSNAKD